MAKYLKSVKKGKIIAIIRQEGLKYAFAGPKGWVEDPRLKQWFQKIQYPFEEASEAEVKKFIHQLPGMKEAEKKDVDVEKFKAGPKPDADIANVDFEEAINKFKINKSK